MDGEDENGGKDGIGNFRFDHERLRRQQSIITNEEEMPDRCRIAKRAAAESKAVKGEELIDQAERRRGQMPSERATAMTAQQKQSKKTINYF